MVSSTCERCARGERTEEALQEQFGDLDDQQLIQLWPELIAAMVQICGPAGACISCRHLISYCMFHCVSF